MHWYGVCANLPQNSPFVLALKFSSPFKSPFFLELETTLHAILTTCFLTCGAFRFGNVKFWARDARTMHGGYQLEWGMLRLAQLAILSCMELHALLIILLLPVVLFCLAAWQLKVDMLRFSYEHRQKQFYNTPFHFLRPEKPRRATYEYLLQK